MSLFPALTGTASALPLPNTAPTPASGELVRAEDVQEAVQALLNQDASLQANLGKTFSVGGAGTPSAVRYTWSSPGSGVADYASSTIVLDVAGCAIDDVIVVTLSSNFISTNLTTGYNQVRLLATDDFGGVASTDSMNGSIDLYAVGGAGATHHPGVSLTARHTVVNPGTTRFTVQAKLDVAASNQLDMTGGYTIIANRGRS